MSMFDDSEFDPQTYANPGAAGLLKAFQDMMQPTPAVPQQGGGAGLGMSVRSEINPQASLIDRLRALQQEQGGYQARVAPTAQRGSQAPSPDTQTVQQRRPDPPGAATGIGNARRAFDYFVNQGLAPHQAAGIVGNLMGESGHDLNPARINSGDGRDRSDSIGIAQWNSKRADALKQYAASKGVPWTDFNTQLEFLHSELKGPEKRAYRALLAASTPTEAGQAMLRFERPKDWNVPGAHPERGRYAAEFYQKLEEPKSRDLRANPPFQSSAPTSAETQSGGSKRQLISRPVYR